MDNKPFRILALAGSLRQGSYNRGLLRAAEELAPEWIEVQFFDIGSLPHFNEDLEAAGDPEVVRRFKEAIRNANAVDPDGWPGCDIPRLRAGGAVRLRCRCRR